MLKVWLPWLASSPGLRREGTERQGRASWPWDPGPALLRVAAGRLRTWGPERPPEYVFLTHKGDC